MKKTVSDVIKERREAKGITQKQMGEFLGMEQSGYAKLEKKGDFIPFSTIRKICELLKCNPIDLIIEIEPNRVQNDSEYKSIVFELLEQINTIQSALRENNSKQWSLQREGLLKQMQILEKLRSEQKS